MVFRNFNRYENAELESEASMIKDLKGRFLMQQLATLILIRRNGIEEEILDLGLPSLSKDNVLVITHNPYSMPL